MVALIFRGVAAGSKWGAAACAALLAFYFAIVGALSGLEFALSEFRRYWFYLVPLAVGFGLQVSLYVAIRRSVMSAARTNAVVATSGTTSAAAMISCCAHYLANLVPVLGASGLVAFASRYQEPFFVLGLLFNIAGTVFIANRLVEAMQHHAMCTHESVAPDMHQT